MIEQNFNTKKYKNFDQKLEISILKILSEKFRNSIKYKIIVFVSALFCNSLEYHHYCQSNFDCVNTEINIYNRKLNLLQCYNSICGFCNAGSDCNGIVVALNFCLASAQICWASSAGAPLSSCNSASYDYGYILSTRYCYICYNNNGISKCPSNTCASSNFYVCAKKCATDSDCPYNMPLCDTITSQCQSCLTNSECSNYGMNICTIVTGYGYCSQSCTSDLDCAIVGFKPYCSAGKCFECPNDEWCHVNRSMKVCHYIRGICLNSCSSNGDCLNLAKSKCSTDGFCVGCTTDTDCLHVLSYKYCVNTICKQCTTNSQCPVFDPIALYCVSNFCKAAIGCNPKDCTLQTASKCSSGSCIACTTNSNCSHILGPRIYCVSGTCVECTTNSHCTSPYKSLCLSNVCSKCTSNADCAHMINGRNTTCNVTSGECVCTTNGGCNNPSLPKCSSGVCFACSTNGDCTHMKNSMTICNFGLCKKSCTFNTDCLSPLNSLCSTSYCSPCSTNADCSHMKGYMTKCVSGECKQCGTNSDCISSYKSACRGGQCGFCLSNADCNHINGDICAFGACLECTHNTDCVNPSKSKCVSNICQPCSTNGDCRNHISLTSTCTSGACSGCQANYNCISATASKCSSGACVACTTDYNCSHIIGGLNCCSTGICSLCITSCTANSDCMMATTSKCNGTICIACSTDSECSHITGGALGSGLHFCVSGICKECTTNSQCDSDDKSLCNANNCKDCVTNNDCSARPYNKVCLTGNCICLINSDCTAASAPICSLYTCIACSFDNECSHITGGALGSGLHFCVSGICKECTTNNQCDSDDKSLCRANNCTDCITNNDCSARPYNKVCFGGNCVCLTNSDCTTITAPTCRTSICVACSIDSECSHITGGVLRSGLHFCVSGICKECVTNSQCNSDDKSLCSGNNCADCIINNDCSARPANKFCNYGNCVQCLVNNDCMSAIASKCSGNSCIFCAVDEDCFHITGGAISNGLKYCVSGVCKECATNSHCNSDNKSLCSANICTDCTTNGDCSLRLINKFCASGNCVFCLTNSNCISIIASYCYDNTCIACVADKDCAHIHGFTRCYLGHCVECTSNSHCITPSASKCYSNSCSGCSTNEDCNHLAGGFNVCVIGSCIAGCITNADCESDDKSICINNKCDDCTNDSDCLLRLSSNKCFNGNCVECFANTQCNTNEKPICNLLINKCVNCFSNGDCFLRNPNIICRYSRNSDSNLCVECIDNSKCTNLNNSMCNINTNKCAPCNTNGDCIHILKYNLCKSGNCSSGCISNNDCPINKLPVCDVNQNICLNCSSDSDCSEKYPYVYCLSRNGCVPCRNNMDCFNLLLSKCTINGCSVCMSDDDCLQFNGFNCSSNGCHSIIECYSNSECRDSSFSLCNTFGKCVGCQSNGDCSHLPSTPECYTTHNYCVECIMDENCNDSNKICDTFECKTTIDFANQILKDKFNLPSIPQLNDLLSTNSKILNTSIVEVAFEKAANYIFQQDKNLAEPDFMNVSIGIATSISMLLNDENYTEFSSEDIDFLALAIYNFTNLTSFQLIQKNIFLAPLNLSAIIISQTTSIFNLLKKTGCQQNLITQEALCILLGASNNILQSLNTISNISPVISINTNDLINQIENRLIDYLNENKTNITIKQSIFSLNIIKINESDSSNLKSIPSASSKFTVDINLPSNLIAQQISASKNIENSLVISLKEWSTNTLPMAGINASFDRSISNASIMSNPVTLSIKDSFTKLPLINTNKSNSLINISIPIFNEVEENKKFGGLFYCYETQEWKPDGIINTTLSFDNKTGIITTSHLTDFQIFSYMENQAVDQYKKSNTDMILDYSMLNPSNTDFYKSGAFIIMCVLTIIMMKITIIFLIYEKLCNWKNEIKPLLSIQQIVIGPETQELNQFQTSIKIIVSWMKSFLVKFIYSNHQYNIKKIFSLLINLLHLLLSMINQYQEPVDFLFILPDFPLYI